MVVDIFDNYFNSFVYGDVSEEIFDIELCSYVFIAGVRI